MTQEEAAQLLQKYIDGNASEKETALVEEWYGLLSPRSELSQLRKIQIADDMRSHISQVIGKSTSGKISFYQNNWFRIAASILIVISVGLFFIKTDHSKINEITVTTSVNQRKQVILPDGSTIVLQPLTKIVYPGHFDSKQRTVRLIQGDAFFDVEHEQSRSFNVQLPHQLNVNVLGTSFNIRDVSDDDVLRVAVATGKVQVTENNKSIAVLTKGKEFNFSKSSHRMIVHQSAVQKIVELPFNGTTLEEVIKKLEYVYSIRINVSETQFLQLKCTANFNSGQTPDEILDILCRLHHLKLNTSSNHKTFKIYR